MRLPAVLRYSLALGVVAVVVAIVIAVTPPASAPAAWYTVLVTVGAVVLLIGAVGWVLRRLWTRLSRSRKSS